METKRLAEGCKLDGGLARACAIGGGRSAVSQIHGLTDRHVSIYLHARYEESRMLRRSKALAVEFCDRCSRVCDAGCSAAAIREQTLLRVLRFGVRV